MCMFVEYAVPFTHHLGAIVKQLIAFVVMIAALSSIAVAQGGKKPDQQKDDKKASVVQIAQEEPFHWDYVLLTDTSGNHTIRAKPLSLTDGNVTLKMRNGHVLTVALSKFSKADRDLLSDTFAKPEDEDVAAGTEFLWEALLRAHERFPQETQVRRETLVKERREEFHKKYDNSKFDLRFTIKDIIPDRNRAGAYVVTVSNIPVKNKNASISYLYPYVGLRLDADKAKIVNKGDKLHISGNVHFSDRDQPYDQRRTFAYYGHQGYRSDKGRQAYRDVDTHFSFDNPTFTIEQTRGSSRLKDAVATKVAELRKLEAGERKEE